MPFALLMIGIVLVTVAVRNTQDVFIALLKNDFSGQGNFFYWVAALLIIGMIGMIPKLKPVSDAFLLLILLALFLTRGNPSMPGGGFFNEFLAALKGTQNAPGISFGAGAIPGLGNGPTIGVGSGGVSIGTGRGGDLSGGLCGPGDTIVNGVCTPS